MRDEFIRSYHFGIKPIIATRRVTFSKLTNKKHEENRSRHNSGKRKIKVKDVDIKVSVSTKFAYLSFIKSLLRAAEREWKYLDKSPNIKAPKPRNNRIRWLEPFEARRLIDECS